MKTLVVYDSEYGNTEKIANILASELSANAIVVSNVNDEVSKADLVIIGTPTHGGAATEPIKRFIDTLSRKNKKASVAVFDTRSAPQTVKSRAGRAFMKVAGFAAPKMHKILIKNGMKVIGEPMGFLVHNMEGPLLDSEEDKAVRWAKQLRSTYKNTA